MLDRSTNLFTTDMPPSGALAATGESHGDAAEHADRPNAFAADVAPALEAPVDDAPAPNGDTPGTDTVAASMPQEPAPVRTPQRAGAGAASAARVAGSWTGVLWRNRRKVLVAGLGLLVGVVLSAALTSAMRSGTTHPSSDAQSAVGAPAPPPTARIPRGKRAAARRSTPAGRKAKRKRDQRPQRTARRTHAASTHVSPPRAAVPSVDQQPVATPRPSAPTAPAASEDAAEFSIER